MAEIVVKPIIDAEGNATFPEAASVSDLIRYAIECSDLSTVQWIVTNWEKHHQPV